MTSASPNTYNLLFHYAFTTSCGNVVINQTPENWFRVSFQHCYPNENFVELLGAYRSLEEAVTAVSSGLSEEPTLDVSLMDLGISPDLFAWDRHAVRNAK